MNSKLTFIGKHIDKRGQLVVFIKNKRIGQIYFVTFDYKGAIRGNHYHKKWTECFGIIQGRIKVELLNIKTLAKAIFILDEDNPCYQFIIIPPYYAHAFKSLTPKASLLNYADSVWTGKDDFKYKLIGD